VNVMRERFVSRLAETMSILGPVAGRAGLIRVNTAAVARASLLNVCRS